MLQKNTFRQLINFYVADARRVVYAAPGGGARIGRKYSEHR